MMKSSCYLSFENEIMSMKTNEKISNNCVNLNNQGRWTCTEGKTIENFVWINQMSSFLRKKVKCWMLNCYLYEDSQWYETVKLFLRLEKFRWYCDKKSPSQWFISKQRLGENFVSKSFSAQHFPLNKPRLRLLLSVASQSHW